LGGYEDKIFEELVSLACRYLRKYKPDKCITGMAAGWDLAWGRACQRVSIPYIAAIPYEGQESRWPEDAQKTYRNVRDHAFEVVVLRTKYSSNVHQIRDEWMVDHATKMVALWDGEPKGGTWNTIEYADKVNKPWINLWSEWEIQKEFCLKRDEIIRDGYIQGWTNENCKVCKGIGEQENQTRGPVACIACGGTGGNYGNLTKVSRF
jgi:hypothetical protein